MLVAVLTEAQLVCGVGVGVVVVVVVAVMDPDDLLKGTNGDLSIVEQRVFALGCGTKQVLDSNSTSEFFLGSCTWVSSLSKEIYGKRKRDSSPAVALHTRSFFKTS